MLVILGAVGLYILISAAILVLLCMRSARTSAHEGWEEHWSPPAAPVQKANATQHMSEEAPSHA